MAFADIGLMSLFDKFRFDTANATLLIDAANEIAAVIGPVKAGNITHIHFRTGTVTGGAIVDCRLETVTTGGIPSGTLVGTTTNALQTLVTTTDDNKWWRVALTLPATVTQNQMVAAFVENPTASFGNIQIVSALEYAAITSRLPYRAGPTRATRTTGMAAILLEYDDGSFNPFLGYLPFLRLAQITLDTGQTPNEAGLYFTPDVPMTLFGYGGIFTIASTADYRVVCYAVGNNTPIATTGTRDAEWTSGTTVGIFHDMFTAAVDLAAGTAYRLAIHPLTTGDVILQSVEAPTAGSLAGLTSCSPQWTQRTRSGTSDPDTAAWTETATRLPSLWPLVTRLSDGIGGGTSRAHIIGG